MEHQRELMEALRDFAMADSEDCDREWGAYLMLLKKGSASVSSLTSSTSPIHHRTRASVAAVTPPSTTNSTTPVPAPSGAASSDCFCEPCPRSTAFLAASASSNHTKDELSPGARHMYDYLIGATENLDEPTTATSSPTSAPSISATGSTAYVYPSSIVTATSATTGSTSATPEVSTVLSFHTEIGNVQGAVDIDATDLAAPVPTTCLVECPSDDTYVYVTATIPSSTPDSSVTTGSIVPELTAPEGSDKALDVSATSDISIVLRVPTEPGVVQAALLPTSCLVESPSSVSLHVLSPLAAPTQSTNTNDDVSELTDYTEKCSSISRHRSKDVLTLPPVTTAAVAGPLRPLPWPSFMCIQFWITLVRQVTSEPREKFSCLVAVDIRVTSLQPHRVSIVHRLRLKHDNICWSLQRLRPPRSPPVLKILVCCTKKTTRSWTHRLETVSSPSSITDNETNSLCVKPCLDDVSSQMVVRYSMCTTSQCSSCCVFLGVDYKQTS